MKENWVILNQLLPLTRTWVIIFEHGEASNWYEHLQHWLQFMELQKQLGMFIDISLHIFAHFEYLSTTVHLGNSVSARFLASRHASFWRFCGHTGQH